MRQFSSRESSFALVAADSATSRPFTSQPAVEVAVERQPPVTAAIELSTDRFGEGLMGQHLCDLCIRLIRVISVEFAEGVNHL